jgi:hypothetical protein
MLAPTSLQPTAGYAFLATVRTRLLLQLSSDANLSMASPQGIQARTTQLWRQIYSTEALRLAWRASA